MAKHLAIDLGTSNLRVYLKDAGIVINEPCLAAVDARSKRVIELGARAKEMLTKARGNYILKKPIENGSICDFDVTCQMLGLILKRVWNSKINRPNLLLCAPSFITKVEKKALLDAAKKADVNEVSFMEHPIAAAIGAGLNISEAQGTMIFDTGGGCSEAAVISFGGLVTVRKAKIGGTHIDRAIKDYLRKNYRAVISMQAAESLKIAAANVVAPNRDLIAEVGARDLKSGESVTLEIYPEEISECISDAVLKLIKVLKSTFADSPAELVQDVMSKGIYLTGGNALLEGLASLIESELNIAVKPVENPMQTVIIGAGLCLEQGL
jgi:rod shape-determining protein MreB